MMMVLWLAAGALAGWLFGRLRRSAMGDLGDALLGIGGGLAGGVLMTGIGLAGLVPTVIGAAGGGVAMVAFVAAVREDPSR